MRQISSTSNRFLYSLMNLTITAALMVSAP